MSTLKIALLVFFFQVVFQSHHVLLLCYESKPLESPFPFQSTKNKKHFHVLINSMILHHVILSSLYEFSFNKDFKDWVKARSTTWKFHFFVMQYNDAR